MINSRAIFTHNNVYDSVLVRNGHVLMMDNEVFKDFLQAEKIEDDFENWGSGEYWDSESEIEESAKDFGDVIAYYNNEIELIVLDNDKWEERKGFYGITE